MNSPLRIGLIGIGGYGIRHLTTLRTLQPSGLCRLVAVADPFADRHPSVLAGLREEKVAILDDAAALCERDDIEAVIIATPIPLHTSQTLIALTAGKHVYLEKPPCATLAEHAQLLAAQERSAKICAVGFQMQTSPAAQFLKQRLSGGEIGTLRTVWAAARWRRNDEYYNRAAWAGKWQLGEQPVFDGPATNALAHAVHGALFLAGAKESEWGKILRVRGSLKKARPIESYDTIFIEAETTGGTLVRLAFTHATEQSDPVVIRCGGDRGRASLTWSGEVSIEREIGQVEEYSFDAEPALMAMLDFLHAVRDSSHAPATTLRDTLPYLQATNGALQSSDGAPSFEPRLVHIHEESTPQAYYTVESLDEQIEAFQIAFDSVPELIAPSDWIEIPHLKPHLAV